MPMMLHFQSSMPMKALLVRLYSFQIIFDSYFRFSGRHLFTFSTCSLRIRLPIGDLDHKAAILSNAIFMPLYTLLVSILPLSLQSSFLRINQCHFCQNLPNKLAVIS